MVRGDEQLAQVAVAIAKAAAIGRVEGVHKQAAGAKGTQRNVGIMLLRLIVCLRRIPVVIDDVRHRFEPERHVANLLQVRVAGAILAPLGTGRRNHRLMRRRQAEQRRGRGRVVLLLPALDAGRHVALLVKAVLVVRQHALRHLLPVALPNTALGDEVFELAKQLIDQNLVAVLIGGGLLCRHVNHQADPRTLADVVAPMSVTPVPPVRIVLDRPFSMARRCASAAASVAPLELLTVGATGAGAGAGTSGINDPKTDLTSPPMRPPQCVEIFSILLAKKVVVHALRNRHLSTTVGARIAAGKLLGECAGQCVTLVGT